LNDTNESSSSYTPEFTESLGPTETVAELPFPWPPGPDDDLVPAFAETWQRSALEPTPFFRAMPPTSYRSALAYYVPLAVVVAGFDLFWGSLFDYLGLPLVELSFFAATPMERVMEFLMSPVLVVLVLFIGAGLVHVTLKILGAARQPLVATTRVLAFASGVQILAVIPILGHAAGGIWSIVLTVIGLREVHKTTTARAAMAILLPIFLLAMLMTAFFILVVMAGAIMGVS
jgi:hypothetical protein